MNTPNFIVRHLGSGSRRYSPDAPASPLTFTLMPLRMAFQWVSLRGPSRLPPGAGLRRDGLRGRQARYTGRGAGDPGTGSGRVFRAGGDRTGGVRVPWRRAGRGRDGEGRIAEDAR